MIHFPGTQGTSRPLLSPGWAARAWGSSSSLTLCSVSENCVGLGRTKCLGKLITAMCVNAWRGTFDLWRGRTKGKLRQLSSLVDKACAQASLHQNGIGHLIGTEALLDNLVMQRNCLCSLAIVETR